GLFCFCFCFCVLHCLATFSSGKHHLRVVFKVVLSSHDAV
ncbi:hypothetical protein, partial [Methylomonas albis]